MFKRKENDMSSTSVYKFGFKIFFVHVINVIVMIVAGMLLENLQFIGINTSPMATPIVVTAVCFIVYAVLVYLEGWHTGLRDNNLVTYKHIEYNKFKPLIAALLSQLIGLILIVSMLIKPDNTAIVKYAKYYYLNFNYFLLVYGDSLRPIYFIPVLFPLIIAPLGYHLGYRQFRLIDRLVFKKPEQNSVKKKTR